MDRNETKYITTSIALGASLTAAIPLAQVDSTTNINLNGMRLFGIVMPAAWTAANLTFQASADGTTYSNMYNSDGTELTVTASTSRYIYLDPAIFASVQFLKIRSGTAGTPVNQEAARTIGLVLRSV